MAQIKKDEIREKIDTAALSIFAEKGYKSTGISDIAKKAQVSVGNIYRYYKGKDELFHSVLSEDFRNRLKEPLMKKIIAAKGEISGENGATGVFSLINEEFIEFMAVNRERMLIIFMGAEGTRYESLKDEIITYLINIVKENYSEKDNNVIFDSRNDYVIRMIYMKLIEMIMHILRISESVSEIKTSLGIINSYHLYGVVNLFK